MSSKLNIAHPRLSSLGMVACCKGLTEFLLHSVAAMPELLKDAGYYTVMAGKWHLGKTKEQSPQARGFDKSFSLLVGGGSHHGWEPALDPGDEKYKLMIRGSIAGMYMEDSDPVNELPKGYYSSDYFTDRLLGYLKEQGDDDKRPFFAYLPFQAPHFPLQVSKDYIEHYRGRYDNGPEALREERIARMKEMNLIPEDTRPADYYSYPQRKSNRPWEQRDKVGRERSARKMEIYAGMVENMDWNIGRVLKHLESTGQLDNTMIFFMSDNGAEGSQLEAAPAHRNLTEGFAKYYDNSLDNLGQPNSYCWYGSRWAQVGTAPSKLYKFFTHQGGIRVCSLVRYPPWQKRAGSICHKYCTIMDVLPTVLDAAGAKHPNGAEYRGRRVEKMLGRSWVPYMSGDTDAIHPDDTITGWEFIGRQALRKGTYKIIRLPPPWGTGEWEMYDLAKDFAEDRDLRHDEPEKFAEMLNHWKDYAKANGIVDARISVEKYFDMQEENLTDSEPEQYV